MRSAQRLASPAEAGIFGRMAKSLHDELAAVSKELADLTETTRIEWERAMGEGHAWTDPEHNDFVAAFEESSGRLVELLNKKRQIERQIRAVKKG
jgi:hypothetical protein